jgi:hypothetical protein
MTVNARFTELYQFENSLVPADKGAGTHTGDWLDMSEAYRAFAILRVGTMGAGGTIDAKIEQAKDASGTDAKNLGKSITQLDQSAGDGDALVGIEIEPGDLDTENGFRYIRWNITVADASSVISAFIIRGPLRFDPPATTVFEELVTD